MTDDDVLIEPVRQQNGDPVIGAPAHSLDDASERWRVSGARQEEREVRSKQEAVTLAQARLRDSGGHIFERAGPFDTPTLWQPGE